MTKNQSACDMLGIALEMEKKGRAFYEQAAQTCQLEECKRIFAMLVEDEKVHAQRIDRLFAALSGDQGWCEWDDRGQKRDSLAQTMKTMTKKYGLKVSAKATDLEALQIAVGMEADAIKFYKTQLEANSDPLAREFLGQLVKEERSHYTALSDMKFYLEDPAGWFREKEKAHFDGA